MRGGNSFFLESNLILTHQIASQAGSHAVEGPCALSFWATFQESWVKHFQGLITSTLWNGNWVVSGGSGRRHLPAIGRTMPALWTTLVFQWELLRSVN